LTKIKKNQFWNQVLRPSWRACSRTWSWARTSTSPSSSTWTTCQGLRRRQGREWDFLLEECFVPV